MEKGKQDNSPTIIKAANAELKHSAKKNRNASPLGRILKATEAAS